MNYEQIKVAFISDNQYVVNTAVAITSIRENRKKEQKYIIYFIAVGVEEDNLKRIRDMSEPNFEISVIYFDKVMCDLQIRGSNVSPAALTKFYLGEILEDIDKVIYLDGDVIVQKDLGELFEISLEDKYAAVVRDIIAENRNLSVMKNHGCSLEFYFNSGMMLLNLKKMRVDRISHELLDYRQNGINFFMDQDALNVVFDSNVEYLPCDYNYLVAMNEEMSQKQICQAFGLNESETMIERILKITVLHLAGKYKPWNVEIPYITDIFMKYYKLSPFADCDCYHPKKGEYNQQEYLFPFELIPKGSSVILWGAGKVGQSFYRQIKTSQYCNVAAWVDERFEEIEKDKNIKAPATIPEVMADYVVIAIKNETVAKKMEDELGRMGIEAKKIVWRYPEIEKL